MDKVLEMAKLFWKREWSMEEKVLMCITALLSGALIGMLISPVRSLIFGSYNGSWNAASLEKEEEIEER